MKKCKSCQMEIDPKAKKCPHCQADQRSWFHRHPILTVILILFTIGISGAALGGSKNTSIEQKDNQPTVVGENKPNPTPMKITARELADDFDSNQVAAENKWKDKLVEFSAQISNITDTGLAFHNVASKDFSLTQISCRVEDKQQLLSLKNGQTVTVRGIVGTQIAGVINISKCAVVE